MFLLLLFLTSHSADKILTGDFESTFCPGTPCTSMACSYRKSQQFFWEGQIFMHQIISNDTLFLYFTSLSSSLILLPFCLHLIFSCSISAVSSLFFLDSSTILVAATAPAKPEVPKQMSRWSRKKLSHVCNISMQKKKKKKKRVKQFTLYLLKPVFLRLFSSSGA